MALALENYSEARAALPALPPVQAVPDLTPPAEKGLGVAAFEGAQLVGFLAAQGPFDGPFGGLPDVRGVFVPMGAHGTVAEDRARIWAAMLPAAMGRWAAAGAASHGVALYAWDEAAQRVLFRFGFGLRCVDAMRAMEPIPPVPGPACDFGELPPEQLGALVPLVDGLIDHIASAPIFMAQCRRHRMDGAQLAQRAKEEGCRYFVARREGEIIAYLKTAGFGETFICEAPGTANICGAYCLPRHRGSGVMHNLLAWLVQALRAEGVVRLGVDYESFNPTAWGFWNKHFARYTHSLTRRVDWVGGA